MNQNNTKENTWAVRTQNLPGLCKKAIHYFNVFLLFTICFLSPVTAQNELNNYLLTAAQNNPGLKAAYNNYLAALEKVPQVGALPDPQLTFGYFIQPVETRLGPQDARLGIAQMFPWFGTLSARKDAATIKAKATYEQFEEAKAALWLDVRSVYYQSYITRESMDITVAHMNVLNRLRQQVLTRIETGKASVINDLRLQMEINELQNQLESLHDQYRFLVDKMGNLMNTELATIELPDSLWMPTVPAERLMDSIRANNPSLKKLEMKYQALTEQERVAKKEGLPQFSIGAEYVFIGASDMDVTDNGRDALLLPKVGVSLPIYRNKYRAKVKEAVIMKEGVQLQKEEQINRLETLLGQYQKENADANRRLRLYRSQKELAKQAMKLLITGFSTGRNTFDELLEVERQLLKYQLEQEKAHTDLLASEAFLKFLMGE